MVESFDEGRFENAQSGTTSEMRDGTLILSMLSTDTSIHGLFLIQGMRSKFEKKNAFRDVETGTYRTRCLCQMRKPSKPRLHPRWLTYAFALVIMGEFNYVAKDWHEKPTCKSIA